MRQEDDVVRIVEQEMSKRGYTTSNHDEGSKRIVIIEEHKTGTVTMVTIEPYHSNAEKK